MSERKVIANKVSFGYRVVSFIVAHNKRLKAYQNPKLLNKTLARITASGQSPENFGDKTKFKDSQLTTLCGMKTYILNPRGQNTIVYLHGGGFINRPSRLHMRFALQVATNTNSKVYVPYYPLAPFNNVQQSLAKLEELVDSIPEPFVLLGDSAGGGLIFSLYYDLQTKNKAQKVLGIASVSPWLDMRIETDEPFADRMLNKGVIERISQLWQGDLPLDHPLVSPAVAKFQRLDALVIVGGDEAFQHDSLQLLATNADTNLQVIEYAHLDHDFALYPARESAAAIKTVTDYICSLFNDKKIS